MIVEMRFDLSECSRRYPYGRGIKSIFMECNEQPSVDQLRNYLYELHLREEELASVAKCPNNNIYSSCLGLIPPQIPSSNEETFTYREGNFTIIIRKCDGCSI